MKQAMPMPRWMPFAAQGRLLLAQLGVAHALHQHVEAALVRQVLELDAAGGDGRIAIVGHDVAAAHLDWVDPQRGGGAVDQVLADGIADRVADGAVLRGRGLVEIDDGGACLEVLVPVGSAGDVEDLVGLEHAGARILRVGAGARQHVDVQAQDLAGLAHGHARLDEVLARMDVGDERLEAVGDELDRAAEHDGGRRRRHLVAVGVDLEAERAADVRGDDLHVVVGNAQRLREHALDHVRALAAGVDGELAGALVVGGEQRARFQADGGVPAEVEGVLDDEIGVGEYGLDIAGVDRLAVGQVVAEAGVDRRRCRIEREGLVDDGRQLLPFDGDALGCIFGQCPGLRHDHDDGLAGPAGAVDRHGMLRRRLHAGKAGERADPGPGAALGQLGAGHHQRHARLLPGLGGVDAEDACVRVRAAHEGGMQHARQDDVVGVAAAPGDGAHGAGPRQRAPHIAVGLGEGRVQASVGHGVAGPRRLHPHSGRDLQPLGCRFCVASAISRPSSCACRA